MNFDTASLVVPLTAFVARYGIYGAEVRLMARELLATISSDRKECAAIAAFLDALDALDQE
jgi:hypothetical protein